MIVTQSTPIYLGVSDYRDTSGPAAGITAGGAADVYPSTIDVPDDYGTVTDVNVDLNGLNTNNLESLHVLLVAPDGRRALLLGHAGGANAFNGLLAFDDNQDGRDPRRRPRAGPQRGPAVRLRDAWHTSLAGPEPDRRHRALDVRRHRRRTATGTSTSTTTTARPPRSTAGRSTCGTWRRRTRPS